MSLEGREGGREGKMKEGGWEREGGRQVEGEGSEVGWGREGGLL